MAGQGRLCLQDRSTRWIGIASSLRFAVILAVCEFSPAPIVDAAEASGQKTPQQAVEVQNVSGTLFFAPEATIEFKVAVDGLTQYASRRLSLQAALYRASDGQVVASLRQFVPIDSRGHCDSIALDFAAPDQPGVYELRFDLTEDEDSLWTRFRKTKPPIVRLGRPLFVAAPQSTTPPVVKSTQFRTVLLHLGNLDWIQTLIDHQPYHPSSDDQFLNDCDSLTRRALRLWTAVGRLSEIIAANEFSGAILTIGPESDAWANRNDLLQLDTGATDRKQEFDQLLQIFAGQQVDVRVASQETVPIVSLRNNLQAMPPEFRQAHRPELAITAAISNTDPVTLAIEFPLAEGPLSPQVREMLGSFAATPEIPLAVIPAIDPANKTVRVRAGVAHGHGYVSVLSLAPWTSEVDLQFASELEWQVVGGAPEANKILRQSETRPTLSQLTLQAGQLVLLKSSSEVAEVSIRSWSASVGGGSEQIEKIKRDVTSVVERMGLLTEMPAADSLVNGGFERAGGIGLVGWMHAQHPPGCVIIDDQESVEGSHSVLLTTDPALSARTWIVSESIKPPQSGRLAVSLVTRAEQKDEAAPHQMRTSIEATHNGEPLRFVGEFEVPRTGQWGSRQIVLETDGVEKQNIDSLRLTIDSLSEGRVWLDDVRIHEFFPTAKEREELQSQTFLAVQGLQHGNLTPSARLLQNPWARYLLTRPPSKNVQPKTEQVQTEKPLGVAERFRSWLPKPIRF